MPVNDSEPRYQLVETDAQGNVTDVLSSVYAEADGTLKLQEGSGSNNEAALQPDGTLDVPKVSTDDLDIANSALISSGDFVPFRDMPCKTDDFETTSTSYVSDTTFFRHIMQWDGLPASANTIQTVYRTDARNEPLDIRLYNSTDGETVFENLNITTLGKFISETGYTPTTTSSPIIMSIEIRADDGSAPVRLLTTNSAIGVSL